MDTRLDYLLSIDKRLERIEELLRKYNEPKKVGTDGAIYINDATDIDKLIERLNEKIGVKELGERGTD